MYCLHLLLKEASCGASGLALFTCPPQLGRWDCPCYLPSHLLHSYSSCLETLFCPHGCVCVQTLCSPLYVQGVRPSLPALASQFCELIPFGWLLLKWPWPSSSSASKPYPSDSAVIFPFYWRQARIGKLGDIWGRAGNENASHTSMSWVSIRPSDVLLLSCLASPSRSPKIQRAPDFS